MIKVRFGTFETNSSSTHSIAIPKMKIGEYPKEINFRFDEYGWAFEEVDSANYLYTAIYERYIGEALSEKLERIKNVCTENGIEFTMEDTEWVEDDGLGAGFHSYGYIDHSEELDDFLEAVFESDESLLNFICFGLVFTGNDNAMGDEMDFVNRDEEEIETYDFENNKKVKRKNPYYKEEYKNYNWYQKWN